MRFFMSMSCAAGLAVCFALSCAAKGPSPASKVRYEPPPALPPYEPEARPDPLSSLEALEVPESAQEDTPVGSGGGPASESSGSGGDSALAAPETQPGRP